MALATADGDPSVERAAPAVLDCVADRINGSRFAQDAMVEHLPFGERPVDKLDRAVDRGAFFIAGDEEADRARERPPGDETQGGGDGGGDPALHVAGAAAPELAVGDFARKRVEPPAA